ncbi:MAG: hypothetical protein Q8O45_06105 [Desulfurivibrionaceae bacterium]|nr:hypothetical protein [Desulfurivibrionaceae bacterium]
MRTKILSTIGAVLFIVIPICNAASEGELNPRNVNNANPSTNNNTSNTTANQKIFDPVRQFTPTEKFIVSDEIDNKTNNEQACKNRNNPSQDKMERYTFWLTVCTGLLVAVTGVLCGVTWLLKRVAAQEFDATHRPKIIVHTFEKSTNQKGQIGAFFTYINTGTSNAIIKTIGHNIFYSDNLIPGAEMKVTEFKEIKIVKPGEAVTPYIESEITPRAATIEEIKRQRNQSRLELLCIGKICYKDSSGAKRETGFCRKFDTATNCWLKVESSDYEYSY